MNKITTTLLLTLSLAAATPALAQSDKGSRSDRSTVETERVAVQDTIGVSARDYARAVGIKDWDKMDDDAIIPITREEAEKLITMMIVEGRADSQRKLKEAEILNDFKVETLKNKLLESALRKVYTEEYDKRLDRLETLLIIALAQQNGGKLDPSVLNYLQGGNATNPALLNGLQGGGEAATAPQQQGSALKPGATQPGTTVPLAPGAKADSWEHFLSQVFFAFDSSKLSADAKTVLDNVAGWIKENNMAVELRGYASPEGNMRYNNRLSGRRVKAAADYLKSLGIADSMLRIVPSGEDTIKETVKQYPDARRVDIRPYYGE